MNTLYAMLGVGVNASAEEIAAGYERMLAMYPDAVHFNDNQRAQFAALREAYATLSDPVRRSLYDQQRRLALQSSRQAGTDALPSPAIEEVKVSGALSLLKFLLAGTVVVLALAIWFNALRG